MSKVVKGIRKVFKKVVKVVKKVAPVVLAAAAIYFTAGAALGVAGTAGGWGAAASTIGSKLGSGVLANAVTGAITQAGYGAAIGGMTAAVGGGSISKGMQAGAITGTVTGGLMGAAGMNTDPLKGIGEEAATQGVTGQPVTPATTATAPTDPTLLDQAGIVGNEEFLASGAPASASAAPATTAPGTSNPIGGLFREGGWVERNQKLVGGMVQGVGQGLMMSGEADAARDRWKQIAGSYQGIDPSAGYRQLAAVNHGITPTQRFDHNTYGSFEFQYDPKQGRIVRVPRGG